jgi:hypothetical protein
LLEIIGLFFKASEEVEIPLLIILFTHPPFTKGNPTARLNERGA